MGMRSQSILTRIGSLLLALSLVLLAVAGSGKSATSAGASSSSPFSEAAQSALSAAPPAPPARSGSGCWRTYDSPVTGAQPVILGGISAAPTVGGSPNSAWAVGTYMPPNSRWQTFTLRWDGERWEQVPAPSPGAFQNVLLGVAALSADNAWAIGSYGQAGTDSRTLILHWDGTGWSQVASPSPGERNSNLLKIAAASTTDIWAVGSYMVGPNQQTLALHWDGTNWSQVPTPNVPGPDATLIPNYLLGVAVVASDDVWAVGAAGTAGAVILHWDGKAWSIVPTPGLDTGVVLAAVAALGPNDVWAVGAKAKSGDGASGSDTLILHWNGTEWSVVPGPSPGAYTNALRAVAAASPDDIWAIGQFIDSPGGSSSVYAPVLHWDGTAWTQVPLADLPGLALAPGSNLREASAANRDLWVVGSQVGQKEEALIVRHTWTPCVGGEKPLSPPLPVPGSASRTFPETGRIVTGIFLDYWEQHGGLMQQGYPISDIIGEVSDLDGKMYSVQYFERAVFEYHPENQPPYNVLLSQLGTFEYRQKYPKGAPNQLPNNDPGSVLFKETGHRLGGIFLQYWQSHGGLAQEGYPISDEFIETSLLNGKSYTVQYFERAVLEFHPENQPPYNVLLSLLERFRFDEKYGSPVISRFGVSADDRQGGTAHE